MFELKVLVTIIDKQKPMEEEDDIKAIENCVFDVVTKLIHLLIISLFYLPAHFHVHSWHYLKS